ncbi:MAG: vitamin K epoxide reductase family protein, partial [Thermotogota bacterium]
SLKTHFQYPSLKSLCDVLEEYKISYDIYKLPFEKLIEINNPFIASTTKRNSEILFIQKIDTQNIYFRNNNQKLIKQDLNEFKESFTGVIIILSPSKESVEPDYKEKFQNNFLIKTTLFFLFVLYFITNVIYSKSNLDNSYLLFVIIIKIIGAFISFLIVLEEQSFEHKLLKRFCNISSAFSCKSVLSSSYAKVFGILTVADISLIYFLASLSYLITSQSYNSALMIYVISSLTVLMVPIMLYVQINRIKKMCPLCLLIQLILLLELILHIFNFKTGQFIIKELIVFGNIFFIIGLVAYLIKHQKILIQNQYFYKYKVEYFLRNPNVFSSIFNSTKVDFSQKNDKLSFQLGNPDSKIKITCFISLSCSSCAKEFKNILNLLDENKNILFDFYFLVSNKEPLPIINTLYHIKEHESKELLLKSIKEWYSEKNYKKWLSKYPTNNSNIIHQLTKRNLGVYKNLRIKKLPTYFINGYLLPEAYELNDIRYHI